MNSFKNKTETENIDVTVTKKSLTHDGMRFSVNFNHHYSYQFRRAIIMNKTTTIKKACP